MSDLFIDEIYFVADGDNTDSAAPTRFTSGTTFLSSVNANNINTDGTNDHQTDGYKWVIEIRNSNTSSIDYENYRLNVCTNYYDPNEADDVDTDYNYYFPSGTLGAIGDGTSDSTSIYIGWSGITLPDGASLLSCKTTQGGSTTAIAYLLADQEDADVGVSGADPDLYYITTRFQLYNASGTLIDRCGSTGMTGSMFNYSPVLKGAFGENVLDNRVAPNSLVRGRTSLIKTVNRPTTSFSTDDWARSTLKLNSNDDKSANQFGALGDPHICTLFGEDYEFDYLGYIRLFDNQHVRNGDENDLIIINGVIEHGPGRWNNKQYIRKLFIYNAGKTMTVNLGFRGSKVTIEHNDGIDFSEEELDFSKEAFMYSFDDHARFIDADKAKKYAEKKGVYIPPLVRNKITVTLCGCEEDTKQNKIELKVSLENVNEYNLQPCRLLINVGNDGIDREAASGCLVNRKYATHCTLDRLDNIDDLPEPTEEEMKNMPELEIKPKLINIKYK